MAANYIRFHLYLGIVQPDKRWPSHGFVSRPLVALLWLVGLLRYGLDVRRTADA